MNPQIPDRVAQINAEIAAQGNKDFSVAPSATNIPSTPPPKEVDIVNQAPKPTSQTNYQAPSYSTQSQDERQLDQALSQRDILAQEVYDRGRAVDKSIQDISMGAVPLNADQLAQVETLRANFQELINQQEQTNQSAKGIANVRGMQKGAAEYSNAFQTNVIGTIISTGISKVAALNTKMAGAIAELTNAFRDNNIENIKSSYDVYRTAATERMETINKTVEEAQARISEQQEAIRKQQEKEMEIQVQTQKDIDGVLNAVAKNGAPEGIKRAVQAAGSLSEAIIAAGGYLQSENDKLDLIYKRAQINKIYADIEKDKLDQASGMDTATLVANANQYAATGQIPSGLPKGTFGAVAQIAKELPKSKGQILSNSTGVTPTGDTEMQKGIGAAYSAVELAKQLKELDEQRYQGLIAGTLGKVFGSEDQQRYLDLRDQIVDLIGKARSGAALSSNEERKYSEMLPGRFGETTIFGFGVDTQTRIDSFINSVSKDISNKASSQGWSINGLSKVDIEGNKYTVGDVIDNGLSPEDPDFKQGRINPDGSITWLN